MSPTQRTKAKLLAEGWAFVVIVERWNAFAHCRQDLFGCIDVLALRGDCILAVQVTTAGKISNRLAKIKENAAAAVWLGSTSRKFVIHGWGKFGARGERKTWQCRERVIEQKDFLPSI